MIVLYIILGVIWGILLMQGLQYFRETRKSPLPEVMEQREKIDITLEDIVRLAAINMTKDIASLLIEYRIDVERSGFYQKFLALNKHERELYFSVLIDIFSRNKREYVQDLFDRYSSFTNQDVLLLLMCEMQLENKTIARIMGLTRDTLKKRKTRLRQKMNSSASAKGDEGKD